MTQEINHEITVELSKEISENRLNRINYFLEEMKVEYLLARQRFRPFGSFHEGYAVVLEEFDELWEEIKKKDFDMSTIKKEAIQTSAMLLAFLTELTD